MTTQEQRELHRRMDRAAGKRLDREDWEAAKPYVLAATAVLLIVGIAWAFWAGGAM